MSPMRGTIDGRCAVSAIGGVNANHARKCDEELGRGFTCVTLSPWHKCA